ncbi:MAG: prepilin-type N-terminal cleavage/methylation domain-containing protein [Pseudomonadota bacterium]
MPPTMERAKQRARARPGAGFTLVELLVAISILAIVAVLGWRGLDGIVRARTALTVQMETTRGMQLAFAQMQSDCEHMSNPTLLHNRPYLSADHDRLTLVRSVFTENEPARVQVVAYRIRDGVLTRRESNATRDLAQLDMLWQAAISDSDTTAAVTLQRGVIGMVVQVWEGNGWHVSNAQMPAFNTATKGPAPLLPNAAPTGLEVALQVQGQETSMTKVFLLGGV